MELCKFEVLDLKEDEALSIQDIDEPQLPPPTVDIEALNTIIEKKYASIVDKFKRELKAAKRKSEEQADSALQGVDATVPDGETFEEAMRLQVQRTVRELIPTLVAKDVLIPDEAGAGDAEMEGDAAEHSVIATTIDHLPGKGMSHGAAHGDKKGPGQKPKGDGSKTKGKGKAKGDISSTGATPKKMPWQKEPWLKDPWAQTQAYGKNSAWESSAWEAPKWKPKTGQAWPASASTWTPPQPKSGKGGKGAKSSGTKGTERKKGKPKGSQDKWWN
jgi:cell division ATPase FtsA